jgi:hypothetical protein
MTRTLVRALAAGLAGAVAGATILALQFRQSPDITFPLDQSVPRVLTGFYPVERDGDLTFAWTMGEAVVTLPGLDRSVAWQCAVRLRGARPPGVPQPAVILGMNGTPLLQVTARNTYESLDVVLPVASEDGAKLTIRSEPTFVPSSSDRRDLGVQVDSVTCRPTGVASPPRRALAAAGLAGAMFGALFAVLGASPGAFVLAVFAFCVAQATAMTAGPALYTPYLRRVLPLAIATVLTGATAAGIAAWWARRRPGAAARFVIGYSSAALFLLLLALLHPSKALVDALFHAHRLEWVHGGRYFFTQPMPDGVAFPYAIALYVVSSPFMAWTRDYVSLLRIVICAVHVLAGLLLYPAIVRRWDDRLVGALAVVLWTLVPQWFVVVGNANLTNAFGQSIATMAMLAAVIMTLGPRATGQAGALFLVTSVALLSHVSTFPLLAVALTTLAACCWWLGQPGERVAGRWIALTTIAAAVFSVVTYYGQFDEAYRSLDRVTGRAPAAVTTPSDAPPEAPVRGGPTPPRLQRAVTAARECVVATGWPMALLAAIGLWPVVASRRRDRLSLALVAWLATCSLFLVASVVGPVEARFYRYTVEFIGRVYYATLPALIVLAAAGASFAWRLGIAGRLLSAALVAGAVIVGSSFWMRWFL